MLLFLLWELLLFMAVALLQLSLVQVEVLLDPAERLQLQQHPDNQLVSVLHAAFALCTIRRLPHASGLV